MCYRQVAELHLDDDETQRVPNERFYLTKKCIRWLVIGVSIVLCFVLIHSIAPDLKLDGQLLTFIALFLPLIFFIHHLMRDNIYTLPAMRPNNTFELPVFQESRLPASQPQRRTFAAGDETSRDSAPTIAAPASRVDTTDSDAVVSELVARLERIVAEETEAKYA